MTEKLLFTKADGIGTIVFNDPDRHNVLSAQMSDRGAEVMSDFSQDNAVKAVVIGSAGTKAWTAGADIREFDSPDSAVDRRNPFLFYEAVRNCPKPVIASIQGYCFGGGVALACACDLRIAATNSVFAIPIARLGGAYPPSFTRWVVEVVGVPYAKEMLFSSRRYHPDDALRINLINRLVEPAQLAGFTQEYVRAIVENAPLTHRASKAVVHEVAAKSSGWDEAYCRSFTEPCDMSADFEEGRRAFAEGRKPVFAGK